MMHGVKRKMIKLVSIDSSSKKTGMATFVNGSYDNHILIDYSKKSDIEERIDLMGKDILSYLAKNKPEIIIIEYPQGKGRNVRMVGKLCEILGIVRAYAIAKGCEYHELAPSVWRSYLGWKQGKKNRDELKQMSIDYIKDKYGFEVTDDESDSIAIGEAWIEFCKE